MRCTTQPVKTQHFILSSDVALNQDGIRVISALQFFNRKPASFTACIDVERWGSQPGRECLAKRCYLLHYGIIQCFWSLTHFMSGYKSQDISASWIINCWSILFVPVRCYFAHKVDKIMRTPPQPVTAVRPRTDLYLILFSFLLSLLSLFPDLCVIQSLKYSTQSG